MKSEDNPFKICSDDQIRKFVKENPLEHYQLSLALQVCGNALEELEESSKMNMNLVAAAYAQNKESIQYATSSQQKNEVSISSLADKNYPETVAKRDRGEALKAQNLVSNESAPEKKNIAAQKIVASIGNLFEAVGQVVINSFISIISFPANSAKQLFASSSSNNSSRVSAQDNASSVTDRAGESGSINYNASDSVSAVSLARNMTEEDVKEISSNSNSGMSAADNEGEGSPALR